jgi:hypothetical protein
MHYDNVKIIILNGKPRAGKDTVAEYTKALYGTYDYIQVHNISTVTRVKDVAFELGWGGEKNSKARAFLSNLKDLWTEFNDGPFNYICDYVRDQSLDKTKKHVVFVHVREPAEIQKLVDEFPEATTLLIVRPEGSEEHNNHSDENVNNFQYDDSINNNGTLVEFQLKIKQKMRYLV